jgi:sec-independent protein translocase protein TatA
MSQKKRKIKKKKKNKHKNNAMLENIGGGELLVIIIIIFIFFGPKKLPEIGKYFGKGIFQFRNALKEVQSNLNIQENITDLKRTIDLGPSLSDSFREVKDKLDIEGTFNNLHNETELKSDSEIKKESNPKIEPTQEQSKDPEK